jgi:hypothetical protein
MKWHKRIRLERDGVDLAAEINAAVAVNRGSPGTTTAVESHSRATAVQDSRHRAGAGEHPHNDPKESR